MSELFLRKEDFERIFKSNLKIETYSKSIDSLFSDRMLRRINYKPYYQRNYVWDNAKATYFIESILLGTEIPPLVFFNNDNTTEIIDGRQRFETIKRFKNDEFQLSKNGLSELKQIAKMNYSSLVESIPETLELFLDAKLRIIEFKIVNEPKLSPLMEDKIKKEIFSRYNTGITPLKRPDIDNAIYDKDPISNYFRTELKQNRELCRIFESLFFKTSDNIDAPPKLSAILQFVRRSLILKYFPINAYASGGERTEIADKLYRYLCDNTEDAAKTYEDFISKVYIIYDLKSKFNVRGVHFSRLIAECFLWLLMVLEQEGIDIKLFCTEEYQTKIINYIENSRDKYSEQDFHYYKQITDRYSATIRFAESEFPVNLQVYLNSNIKFRNMLAESSPAIDTVTKLSELEALRLKKPDPSKVSIDDITRIMERRTFLVRPTYQRSEVINLTKASSIIESILLDVPIPAIFVYKRTDGVSEVIDGQQRLLSMLGYLGAKYVDENGILQKSNNHEFRLRNLKILKEFNNQRFNDLPHALKDKIYDFEIFVVEIEEKLNPNFNPIDLFIRLNDKPYPILQNSFEMWNSWADMDVITRIKENTKKVIDWFYVRNPCSKNYRDRMENEELYTSLAYLDYNKHSNSETNHLDIYQKSSRINSRIQDKKHITNTLTLVSENPVVKETFLKSIRNVEQFLKKVRIVLLDRDVPSEKLADFFKNELDKTFNPKQARFRRTRQDFYILWFILNDINLEMIKFHRISIKEEIKNLFYLMKDLPNGESTDDGETNEGLKQFLNAITDFKNRYTQDVRKVKLTEDEKHAMIISQEHKCGITGAPVFLGDDVEVDHQIALGIGGKDSLDNLQIAHMDSNRKKGVG